MSKVRNAIALTAIVHCAAVLLGSGAVEARDRGWQWHQELKEQSLLESDQKRFARGEALLRKSVRRHTDKDHISDLQDRVRRDLRDIVDVRGRPDSGALGDSSSVAKRRARQKLS